MTDSATARAIRCRACPAGESGAAGRTLRTALNVAEKIGARGLVADVLTALGAVTADAGSPDEAIACYRQALAAHRFTGSLTGQIAAGNNLGWQLFVNGDVAGAVGSRRGGHGPEQPRPRALRRRLVRRGARPLRARPGTGERLR